MTTNIDKAVERLRDLCETLEKLDGGSLRICPSLGEAKATDLRLILSALEPTEDNIERVARAIAEGLGDDFNHAFEYKSQWNEKRGESGGRYRDINEPMQHDYLQAARAAIQSIRDQA